MTFFTEFVLHLVYNMNEVIVIISSHIFPIDELLTDATIEAIEFSVTISTASAPIFHGRCYLSTCVFLLLWLTLPAFPSFFVSVLMIASAKFV